MDLTRDADCDHVQLGAVRVVRALALNPVIREIIRLQDEMGINANIEKLVMPSCPYSYCILT